VALEAIVFNHLPFAGVSGKQGSTGKRGAEGKQNGNGESAKDHLVVLFVF
jgi:hypothetical protein